MDVNVQEAQTSSTMPASPVALRLATPGDAPALVSLAALDSAPPLDGPVLLAHRDDHLLAAVALTDGREIADPFAPTAGVLELLRLRARQIPADQAARRRPRVRLRAATVQSR
jgi:hypothetical protein